MEHMFYYNGYLLRSQYGLVKFFLAWLARYFGTSAAVWLWLQVRYDLEAAEGDLAERIEREVKVLKQPSAHA